jgi:hypothetical protein
MPETIKSNLDPFRIIVGVLANRNESDLLVSVTTAAGLRYDLQMSEEQSATNKQRIRVLLPNIFAAYDALNDQEKLTAASIAIINIGASYHDTRDRAIGMLARAGWEVRGDELVVVSPLLHEMFFPEGSQWDAHVVLRSVFVEATSTLTIIDAYADGTIFRMLTTRPLEGLTVQILCAHYAQSMAAEARTFVSQYPRAVIEVRQANDFHDRFIIVDGQSCVHVGASIKDAGKTAFMVSRVEDPDNLAAILNALRASWDNARAVA